MKIIETISAIFQWKEEQKNLVFMIKSRGTAKDFPGYYGFPWGKLKQKGGNPTPMAALKRVVNDLLGFDLETALQSGQVKQIKPVGTAVILELPPLCFSTSFFCIELTGKPGFTVDAKTAAEAGWETPEHYLKLYREGQILVLPAVLNLLKRLPLDLTRDTPLKGLEISYDDSHEVPWFQPLAGVYQLAPIAFTFAPDYIHRTNCFVVGDPGEEVLVIDPSPQNDDEYRKLKNTLKRIERTPTGIFITHHHQDHHQGSAKLARDLAIPLIMSQITYRRILKRNGEHYFANLEIKCVREGDTLARWLGKAVTVYEIPGHDEGQLALAPESMEWFLVGDLIQSEGTVVIAEDEGDMAEYYRSLERVIQLNPRVVLPSHGIPLGSTAQLEDTLKHRKIREQQVLHLFQKGKTPGQIVKIIYHGVDRRLWPLALENIKSHLKKLKQEQVI